MIVLIRVSFLAVLFLAAAAPATAQLIPDWDTKQFTIERLDADRVLMLSQVEVVGTGPNVGKQIFADRIEWNVRTGEFVASGNVLLVSPTSRLAAERVVFNTKTSLGTFEVASGIASLEARGVQDQSMFGMLDPDVYFYGDTIEKIGEDKYKITRGGFTTCVQPTPRWEIVGGSTTINLGDYAVLRNAVVRVKDVPVFYLPILYYPIQDDGRATGFLMPTYGTSTYRGASLSNAFFWAINRSQDATLFHDWYTSRGQGYGGEYRYVSGPNGDGVFRAYRLTERESVVPNSTVVTPARESFELRGRLVQSLPAKMTARANVDYFSDVTTQQLYNSNIYYATRSQRSFGGTVSGNWGRVSTTGTFSRSELFLSSTSSLTTGSAPGANLSISSTRLGPLPVFFAMTNDFARTVYLDRFTNATGEVVNDLGLPRIDLFPTLRAPLTKWPFLTVNASVAAKSTYFGESETPITHVRVEEGFWRRYAQFRTDVIGPSFSRVFTPGRAFAERLKHVIEPTFSLQRTTNVVNNERVPTTGSTYDTVVGDTTQMSYGFTNRLLVRPRPKKPVDGEPAPLATASAPRELLNVSIFQTYYTVPLASRFDTTIQSAYYRPLSNFSPIVLNARTAPTELTTSTVLVEYDPLTGILNAISASGSVNYQQVQVRGGWTNRLLSFTAADRSTQRTNTLDALSTLNFKGGRTGGTYTLNWDITRRQILQQRWTGFYNAQCCGFMVEYQEFAFGLGAALPKDRRFNLSFTLAGIGSFSNFFGAFGGGGMGSGRY